MYCLCRHTQNWLRNTDSQKKFETKFHGNFSKNFVLIIFFGSNFSIKLRTVA
jgi:hypothetical protein